MLKVIGSTAYIIPESSEAAFDVAAISSKQSYLLTAYSYVVANIHTGVIVKSRFNPDAVTSVAEEKANHQWWEVWSSGFIAGAAVMMAIWGINK